MNIRRYYVPNAIVFITQVVEGRTPIFANDAHLDLLLTIIREARERHPFQMLGYVFLPDHFHMLIKPEPGLTHSQIMLSIKPNFTKAYKQKLGIEGSMRFWQRRYWDHVIRSDEDFEHHLNYIHYNPVRHGLAARPEDWAHSSYRHWQERGAYPAQWGWALPAELRDMSTPEYE